MKTLINFFSRFTTKKIFRLMMLLFFISTFIIDNPWFGQKHLIQVTNGLGMIDMHILNSADSMYTHLLKMGNDGIAIYQSLLILDYLLIFTLGGFQVVSILRLLKQVSNRYQWLIITPILRGAFDGVENILLYISTIIFPGKNILLFKIASVFIFLKWIAFWLTIIILLSLAIINLYLLTKKGEKISWIKI